MTGAEWDDGAQKRPPFHYALFRRFDTALHYDLPTETEVRPLIKNRLATFKVSRLGWKRIAESIEDGNLAQAHSLCHELHITLHADPSQHVRVHKTFAEIAWRSGNYDRWLVQHLIAYTITVPGSLFHQHLGWAPSRYCSSRPNLYRKD